MEGQLATQQSQTNEHLEALQQECNTLLEAATQAVTERDTAHQDVDMLQTLNQRLRATMRSGQPASVPDPDFFFFFVYYHCARSGSRKSGVKVLDKISL